MRRLLIIAAIALVLPQHAAAQSTPPAETDKPRDSFLGSFFTGVQIDSFAADDLNRYLNPGESSKVVERVIAGFDFQYRLFGNTDDTGRALWVYGETIHGIRSADVDCADDANLVVCQPFKDVIAKAPDRALYILRKATSLEAFAGARYEFATLQPMHDEARLYVKAQLGFLTVAGTGKDVIDMHQVAIGAGAVRGKFQGSYLDVGWGRTDLFHEHPGRRFKVDGYLTWPVDWVTEHLGRPFVQMTVDADLSHGADSIQSFIGFDFDLSKFWNKPE